MKTLRYIVACFAFLFFIASPIVAVAVPTPVSAACDDRLLGIPPWYRGVTTGPDCLIQNPVGNEELGAFITKIALNIVEIMMVITAYIALFFILYGGFLFIANNGSSETVQKGSRTVLNAIIGLAISLGAVAILNFVFGIFVNNQNDDGFVLTSGNELLQAGLNTAYFIAGVVAVIVIIVAGLTYATSQGDSGKLTKAKNQILYAIIGLILVLAAWGITNFVMERF